MSPMRRRSHSPDPPALQRLRALTTQGVTAAPATPHNGDTPPDASSATPPTEDIPAPPYASPEGRGPASGPPPGYVEVDPHPGARHPWLTALADRLTARGGDLPRLGRSGLYALVGVCAIAVLATAWFALRARPEPAPAPEVRSGAGGPSSPGAPVPSPTGGSPAPTGKVTVHVGGDVKDPGVVTLPASARVSDAVDAAGGATKGTDPNTLNLARPLVDGEQILVGATPSPQPSAPGAVPPVPGSPGAGPSGGAIDLNTATADQLQELPGVGPVLAQRIIEYRDQNGGFASVEQLNEVSGIGEKRFAELSDQVRVGGAA